MKKITQKKLKQLFKYRKRKGGFKRYPHIQLKGGECYTLGSTHHSGYRFINYHNISYPEHHLVWLLFKGAFPDTTKYEIDHKNRNRSDNRIENLRLVDRSGNAKNHGKRVDNTSGCTGVAWRKEACCWRARLYVGKKCINLGNFIEYSEAVNARKNAEVLYGFVGD